MDSAAPKKPRKPRKKINIVPEDCMPKCEACNAATFEQDAQIGECHLLPMDWVETEAGLAPMWKPCYRNGWCKHFDRRTN